MQPWLTRTLRLLGLLEAGRSAELRWRMGHSRALPDVVILGAQKSGTSSLHQYLLQPDFDSTWIHGRVFH